jgi:hypothetical protein
LVATADSQAAVLCKKAASAPTTFTCPIVENMSTNGSKYSYGSGAESTWTVTGPWGSWGAIAVNGNSRCSSTSETYPNIGNPTADGGKYCWCQIVNEGVSGAWAFWNTLSHATDCASRCASFCARNVEDASTFRAAICVPPGS